MFREIFAVVIGESAFIEVLIRNLGKGELIINALSIGGPDTSEFSIADDTCSGAAVIAAGNCTLKVIFAPLSYGIKTAILSVTSNDPVNPEIFIDIRGTGNDIIPPVTTILEGPANLINTASTIFVFEANEPGSSFECRLDGGDFAQCESPLQYFGLSEGVHLLEIKAIDVAGNREIETASHTWIVDTIGPDAPVVGGVTPIRSVFPVWLWSSGGGGGNGIFRYQVGSDADIWMETTETMFMPADPQSEGSYILYVQERDDAGNWSASGLRTITVDITEPMLTMDPVATPTRASSQTISGTVEEGVIVTVFLDTSGAQNPADLIGTSWSYSIAGLVEGLNGIIVTATDNAGNSAVAGDVIELDTTPPEPPVVTGITPTVDTTPEWSWTSGGNGNYRYKLDNSDLTTGATETIEISFTPGSPLSIETHILYVQARDAAGNWSASGSFAITIEEDTDGDGLSDSWEFQHFGDLSRNGAGDLDGDGISDYQEYLNGTDPVSCLWHEVDSTHLDVCVNNVLVLQKCLTEAESDGKHNTIMVVQGEYKGHFVYKTAQNFDLSLYGGYTAGCESFSSNPTLTVLDGDVSGE